MSRIKQIQTATRQGKLARVALAGPAGSGKTFTALTIARVFGEKIVVIDTERGSASLYSDEFAFQTIDWQPPYDPIELANDIKTLGKQFDVIVIDSASHFWMGEGGTLEIADAAGQRASGNKFAGWKVATPAQNQMIEAMLGADAHVIVTMRSKMEYVQEKDADGKTVVRKIGLQPVQRDSIEFEFTVTCDLDIEHRLMVTKSRCKELADRVFQPGKAAEIAEKLFAWLNDAAPARELASEKQVEALMQAMNGLPIEIRPKVKQRFIAEFGKPDQVYADDVDRALDFIEAESESKIAEAAQ